MKLSAEEKNQIRSIIASEFGYALDDVVDYEPSFDGEIVFKSGSNFFSVFGSDEEAKEFYEEAFKAKAKSNPREMIKTFDHELGKDQWMNFISRESMAKVLLDVVGSIKSKPDKEILRKIKETPFSVVTSFFNMTEKSGIDKFYKVLLSAIDRSVYEKTAESLRKQAEVFNFKMDGNKRVTVWKW
jgi:hypothetical protein